jgi:hypothetical protein
MRSARGIIVGGIAAAVALGAGTAYSAGGSSSGPGFLDDFARHLGISPSKVRSAWLATMADRLDQAVRDGRLSQAQADRILAELKKDGPLDGPGPLGGLPPGQMWHDGGHGPPPWAGPKRDRHLPPGLFFHPGKDGVIEAASSYLDVSAGELFSQLRSGRTLAQIASVRGKPVSGLEDALVKAARQEIQSALDDGRLTKSQAARLETDLEQHVHDLVQQGFRPRGHGDEFDGSHDRSSGQPPPGNADPSA